MEFEICRLIFLQQTSGKSWWEVRQPTSGQEMVIFRGESYVDQYWKRTHSVTGALVQMLGNVDKERYRSEEQKKAANLRLVAQLASIGWEPTTFDDKGLVTSLKRVKSEPETKNAERNQSAHSQKPISKPSPDELLRQLATLRDAGILSQDEFDAKKSEILKRI